MLNLRTSQVIKSPFSFFMEKLFITQLYRPLILFIQIDNCIYFMKFMNFCIFFHHLMRRFSLIFFQILWISKDKEIFIPWCDKGVWDTEISGHHRRSNLHYQQCQDCVLEWEASTKARKRGHQYLPSLWSQPPWFLQLLLSWL